jgi:D-alanine-D-alanine ligase
MLIGLTYDLRSIYLAEGYGEEETAEFDREETIVALEKALRELGQETDRVGRARELVQRLAAGNRWDLVFNIAEGMNGIGRESQVPAILDVYHIPYTFSDPLVMGLTLHKGLTKRVLRDAGIPTPDFKEILTFQDTDRISFPAPYFVKPMAEGTGRGIGPDSIIHDAEGLRKTCGAMMKEFHQGLLVETFLPGREFTVGLLGTGVKAEVIGTMEVHLLSGAEPHVYSYANKERSEDLVEYQLVFSAEDKSVAQAEEIALKAWRFLGCRDAGRIDLRCDASGQPYFLEVNPLAGLHPTHSDLPIICQQSGIPYIRLIERILESASQRLGKGLGK